MLLSADNDHDHCGREGAKHFYRNPRLPIARGLNNDIIFAYPMLPPLITIAIKYSYNSVEQRSSRHITNNFCPAGTSWHSGCKVKRRSNPLRTLQRRFWGLFFHRPSTNSQSVFTFTRRVKSAYQSENGLCLLGALSIARTLTVTVVSTQRVNFVRHSFNVAHSIIIRHCCIGPVSLANDNERFVATVAWTAI